MEKKLQETIKSSKNNSLTDIVKKKENSYVIKSLDYVDKRLRLKEYFPDSKVAKNFDRVKDFFVYSYIGFLPGEKQKEYTEHLDHNSLKFTKYSVAYEFSLGFFKLGLACASPYFSIFAGLGIWSIINFADGFARIGYMSITKKPIGALPYTEWPYQIGKFLLKKRRNIKPDKSKSLNSSDFLDLS